MTSSYVELTLNYPTDITVALRNGEINLYEAGQLARLKAVKLGCTTAEARVRRSELLRSHTAEGTAKARET
jgi:hypothetical protein